MRIDLNLPRGAKQRLLLDRLNAALRKNTASGSGLAGVREDGLFESTLTAVFPVGRDQVLLVWTVTKSPDGTLLTIEVNCDDTSVPESTWKDAASQLVTSALAASLAEKRDRFFRQAIFHYVGTQLDGEYWLPGFRFAPVYPEDPQPLLVNAERVVSIDMIVHAIDGDDASALADEAARRQAARLSLLLNVGLYRPEGGIWRWVRPYQIGQVPLESVRYTLGFQRPGFALQRMPPKGKLCALGQYKGSLIADYRIGGELVSLPPETRRILRCIESAQPHILDAFDRAARLYQVAMVVGPRFPSVGLAYRVAAVDAISGTQPDYEDFKDFVRKNVEPRPDLDALVDYLYGSVRSAHFHGGAFPLGEFAAISFFHVLMDPEEAAKSQLHRACRELTREAIVNWLKRVALREGDPEGEASEDPRSAQRS